MSAFRDIVDALCRVQALAAEDDCEVIVVDEEVPTSSSRVTKKTGRKVMVITIPFTPSTKKLDERRAELVSALDSLVAEREDLEDQLRVIDELLDSE